VSVDLPSHGETDAEIPGVFTQEDQARVLSDFMVRSTCSPSSTL